MPPSPTVEDEPTATIFTLPFLARLLAMFGSGYGKASA